MKIYIGKTTSVRAAARIPEDIHLVWWGFSIFGVFVGVASLRDMNED